MYVCARRWFGQSHTYPPLFLSLFLWGPLLLCPYQLCPAFLYFLSLVLETHSDFYLWSLTKPLFFYVTTASIFISEISYHINDTMIFIYFFIFLSFLYPLWSQKKWWKLHGEPYAISWDKKSCITEFHKCLKYLTLTLDCRLKSSKLFSKHDSIFDG